MSLRERCIEAGVRAIGVPREYGPYESTVLILDAVLDVLEESAEEWEREVPDFSAAVQVYGAASRRLIGVLRGNGE